MKKSVFGCAIVAFAVAATAPGFCQDGIDHELNNATQIVRQMTGASSTNGIPSDVLKDAQCMAVVPNVIQAGFIVGGRHGSGVATCRTHGDHWSPPAPFSISGASFGAQIGGRSIDLIMMVMNHKGMQALVSGHFKVGGEVSGAAGPVGRSAAASGGWKADILSYSRTKGAYAGATVKGAELQQDDSATKALYGHDVKFSQILNGNVSMPNQSQAGQFVHTVRHAVATASSKS